MLRQTTCAAGLTLLLGMLAVTEASAAPSTKRQGAKKLAVRPVSISKKNGHLQLSAQWRDMFDATLKTKMLSGLPTLVVTEAYLFNEQSPKALSLSVATCRIVYDLWDEVFRIEHTTRGRTKRTVAINTEGALRHCGQVKQLTLSPLDALRARKRHFVAVRIQVNPLDDKMLKRIRKWVARPQGRSRMTPSDSLLGSFVGLFITHLPKADRDLAFRSSPFVPSRIEQAKRKSKPRRKNRPRAAR